MTADAVPKRRKFCLRLDDGTLISGSSKHTGSESVAIVLLKPQECYERGLLQVLHPWVRHCGAPPAAPAAAGRSLPEHSQAAPL